MFGKDEEKRSRYPYQIRGMSVIPEIHHEAIATLRDDVESLRKKESQEAGWVSFLLEENMKLKKSAEELIEENKEKRKEGWKNRAAFLVVAMTNTLALCALGISIDNAVSLAIITLIAIPASKALAKK